MRSAFHFADICREARQHCQVLVSSIFKLYFKQSTSSESNFFSYFVTLTYFFRDTLYSVILFQVTEMKLGHALLTIQRAYNLHQDNRGIWVDLDVDYEGGIMLTIETMINLEYYLKRLTDQGKSDSDEVILKLSREDSSYSDVVVHPRHQFFCTLCSLEK